MDCNKTPVVVGLGEVLWDVFPHAAHFGGAPANFACHAAALGAETYMVSAVGFDELGHQVFDEFAIRNVGTEYLQRYAPFATGTVNVAIDEQGKASYQFASDTAWDNLGWTELLEKLAARTDAVCFGTLAQRSPMSRQTIKKYLESVPRDCLRIFDVNLRQDFYNRDVIEQSLQMASILKLNEEELPVVASLLSIPVVAERDRLRWLRDQYQLHGIALTRGAEGSVVLVGDHFDEQKPPSIKVVDTVGAGDSFTAALTIGLLEGDSIESTHKRASDLAAYVCTQSGATPKPMG